MTAIPMAHPSLWAHPALYYDLQLFLLFPFIVQPLFSAVLRVCLIFHKALLGFPLHSRYVRKIIFET